MPCTLAASAVEGIPEARVRLMLKYWLMDSSLASLWEEALEQAPRWRAEAEAAVAHMVWSTTDAARWTLFMLERERKGQRPGRVLDGPPAAGDRVDEYGYDAQGRLVVATLGSLADGRGAPVLVRRYVPEGMHEIRFTSRGELLGVGRQRVEDGRVVEADTYTEREGRRRWLGERYTWGEHGVVLIERRTDDDGASDAERERFRAGDREEVTYDEFGRVLRITHTPATGGERVVVYAQSTPVDLAKRVRALGEALDRAVAAMIAAKWAPGEIWAVAIVYDLDEPVPPALRVCTHDELRRRADARPLELIDADPSEWEEPGLDIPLGAYGFDAPDAMWTQVRLAGIESKVIAEYQRVARKLSKDAARRGDASVYVVVALENGASDPLGSLQASLTRRDFERLLAPLR